MRIGFYDSGIGGFSILNRLLELLPVAEYYYVADNRHAPYGDKSDEFLFNRACEIFEELIKKEVELIVVACNTVTAATIEKLRTIYKLPIVGVEPYLNILNQRQFNPNDKIVAMTTLSMSQSERYKKLKERLDPQGKIHYYASPKLASAIEEANIELIKSELDPLKGQGYTHAILGCTHYPLINEFIQEYLQLETISPCLSVAKRVIGLVSTHQAQSNHQGLYLLMTRDEEWREVAYDYGQQLVDRFKK